MAVAGVIAYFVFVFSNNMTRIWSSNEAGVGTELEAQLALDRIVMDIESAVLLEKGVPMFALSILPRGQRDGNWDLAALEGSARPEDLHYDPVAHHYGWAGSWLRFFSAVPSLNAVGYKLVRRSAYADSSQPLYLLYRPVVRHDRTLDAGLDITAADYLGGASSSSDSGVIGRPWRDNLLLEDVVDFGLRLFVVDEAAPPTDYAPGGLRMIFPVLDGSGDIVAGVTEHLGQSFSKEAPDAQRYPDVVEVYIRVVDDVGAEKLLRSQEVEAGQSYETIVASHGRLYSRTIWLPGRN